MKFLGGNQKRKDGWKSFMEVLNFHGGDELFPCAPFRVGSRQRKTVPSLRQKADLMEDVGR